MSLMTADRVRLPRRLSGAACALVLGGALLAGCHPSSNIIYGTGVLTMSTVSGEFTSYIVSIDDITMTRNDGLVIEPLATPEIVDLTKYQDLTELLQAPAIPVGTYTSLTLLLDYTEASITVDVNGVATGVLPVDTAGTTMTSASLTVTFDPANRLVINNQQGARLALGFNLAAFNSLNQNSTVTVVPFVTATPVPVDSTVMRARGLMVVTQPAMSNYIQNMRPLNDLVSALGALTVNTSASTYFNVNGTIYQGAAGLAAMGKLPVDTTVAAEGTLDSLATITPSFNATAVYAGDPIESPLADYITGVVAARSGNSLTIHGASCVSREGSTLGVTYTAGVDGGMGYFDELPVTLGPDTLVTEDGVAASGLTAQSISVGQLITVAGQASTEPYCLSSLTLDATEGLVRLLPTPAWGTLNSGAAGSMSLDLLSLGGFEPSVFSFAGTGSSAANDAVATAYAIDTGTLNEGGTAAGTLLEASGFANPFGSAPPDFTASTVTGGSATPQQLVAQWGNGTSGGATKPFLSLGPTGLIVDLTNPLLVSSYRYIATGPQKTDLLTLPASPKIVFAAGTPLTLAICNNTAISIYNSATGFAAALANTLSGTNAAYRLAVVGQYDAATNIFTATQVAVNLEVPSTS
jgi:Domain of unknown function (DUF4382)